MPASSWAARAMDSLKVSAGGTTATAESVAMSGRSSTVFGKRGVTVDTARIRTGRAAPCRCAYSRLDSTRAVPPSEVAQIPAAAADR